MIVDPQNIYYADSVDGYIDINKIPEYHYLINRELFRVNQSRTDEDQSQKHYIFSQTFDNSFYRDALYEPYAEASYYLVNLKQEEVDAIFFDVIEDL